MSKRKTAGGTFDPAGAKIYFLAGHPGDLGRMSAALKHPVLIATNEVGSDGSEAHFRNCLEHCPQVLLDSGAFNLANALSLRQGIPLPTALGMPLDQIPGVPALLERYRRLARAYEDKLWGYIEVDLGGVAQKIATRTAMEGEGLRPIPVYHARSDGRDYLEELLDKYDRIAVGNVVDAAPPTRMRYFRTVWETVQRRAPDCWVHYLGVECGQVVFAYPSGSVDSSTWSVLTRWGNNFKEFASGASLGPIRHELQPRGDGIRERGTAGFQQTGIYRCHFSQENWRRYHRQLTTGERYEVPAAEALARRGTP